MHHAKVRYYLLFGLSVCLLSLLATVLIYVTSRNSIVQKQTATTTQIAIAHKANVMVANGRKLFYSTEYGEMAFLPDVDSTNTPSSIGTFWVFEHGGIYTLKLRHDPLWFQINHHLPESNSEARHSGLLIITVNTSGSTHSVETYRNANWHMPGSNKVLGEFFNTKELNWQDFDSLIGSSTIDETNVEILDSKLGGPWHAVPDGGTRYSWEYRNFWNWATEEFKKESANIVGDSNASYYRVSARLLAFRPTLQLDSKLPVTFYTQADHGDVIFMATYILEDGDQDLRKWYWFKIE